MNDRNEKLVEDKLDDLCADRNDDLFSLLVAAFTAGEKLGQANAKSIYQSTYPEEEVSEAAPKYAKSIIRENDQAQTSPNPTKK